mgnify:CR=1 FL=1
MEKNFKIFKTVLKNDFQILMKYKLNLLTNLFSIIFFISVIFFFSETFEIKSNTNNSSNENSLFLFFLSGLLLLDLTINCSIKFPLTVSFYQTSGIMEELISEFEVFLSTIIFSISIPLFMSIIKFLIYLLLSKYFIDSSIVFSVNLLILIPYLFVYLCFIVGIGLVAGSLTILFKRGNPVIQLNNILTLSLTGAFIPVSQLGWILDSLSFLIPGKHYLDILRSILGFNGLSFDSLLVSSSWLILLSLLVFLFGVFIFKQSINYAKLIGNISNY